MLPKRGQPTYAWPLYGWPLWPTTLNAPAFFVRFNYATSVALTSDCDTQTVLRASHCSAEALSMTAETKGF